MTWTIPPRSEGPGGLALSRAGAGAPVVLIHGVGLRSEAWARQIEALAPRFEVVAVDLPGHGRSAPLDGAPDLAAFAARIAGLLGTLSGPAFLAGHSLGALIALEIAFRHPEACRGVAALNAIHRRDASAKAAVRARAEALDPTAARAPDPEPTLARWFGADRDGAAKACGRWLREAAPGGYAAAYRAFAEADGPAEDDLRALAAPALFLTGAADPNSTPAMAARMAALAPQGRAETILAAAHMAPMTHAPGVTAALLACLEASGLAEARDDL